MTLDSDDAIRIYKEAVLGTDSSETDAEAIAYREKVDADISEIREAGGEPSEFLVPSEHPALD